MTSNIDLPNFGRNDPAGRFRFRSEKSNSCRLRNAALAMAFLGAASGNGYEHRRHAYSIAFQSRVSLDPYNRLMDMACEA